MFRRVSERGLLIGREGKTEVDLGTEGRVSDGTGVLKGQGKDDENG